MHLTNVDSLVDECNVDKFSRKHYTSLSIVYFARCKYSKRETVVKNNVIRNIILIKYSRLCTSTIITIVPGTCYSKYYTIL